MYRLDGKVALVSGAARGIGAAIAEALAHNGAKVVLGDLLDGDGQARAEQIGPSAAETNGGSLRAMLGPNGVYSHVA